MRNFLHRCSRAWRAAHFWYRLLSPARMGLIVVLLVPVLFIKVPQGEDILRRIGAESLSGYSDSWYGWHRALILLALFVLGVSNWGWVQFLLNCDFPGTPKAGTLKGRVDTVRKWFRRACGFLPSLCLAVAFGILWRKSLASHASTSFWYGYLSLASFGIGVLLYIGFEVWHRKVALVKPRRYRNVREVYAHTFAFTAIVSGLIISLAMFVSLTIWPVMIGEMLGSAAVLLLAMAAWIGAGSVLVYFGSRYRVPVITVALLLAVLFSPLNDNHHVRTLLGHVQEPGKPDFAKALDQWLWYVTKKYPTNNNHNTRPLYLVAAAGGGIRAAYWTAIVLAELEDHANADGRASFAEHTFVLSGVSGGSLGEVTFASLIASGPTEKPFRSRAQWLLDDDFLAADLAKMCFADLLQRFLPVPICSWDRARSLEDAWAEAWVKTEGTKDDNPLEKSIGDLYVQGSNRNVSLPHLLLNGTSVETGKRIITSDLLIRSRSVTDGVLTNENGEFIDVIPAADKLQGKAIRLSTAVHQSARFTYFSPAGRFSDGTRIVDGGYFENSGAATLMNALDAVRRHIGADREKWAGIEPTLILIDNDPLPMPGAKTDSPRPYRFLPETLSPVYAMLNTRDARCSYASQEILNDAAERGTHVFEFHLYDRDQQNGGLPLPLGWTLSGDAIAEMNAQLPHWYDTNAVASFPMTTNAANCATILENLPLRPK